MHRPWDIGRFTTEVGKFLVPVSLPRYWSLVGACGVGNVALCNGKLWSVGVRIAVQGVACGWGKCCLVVAFSLGVGWGCPCPGRSIPESVVFVLGWPERSGNTHTHTLPPSSNLETRKNIRQYHNRFTMTDQTFNIPRFKCRQM